KDCTGSFQAVISRRTSAISRCDAVLPTNCGVLSGFSPLLVSSKITSSHSLSVAGILNGTTWILTSRVLLLCLRTERSVRVGLFVLMQRRIALRKSAVRLERTICRRLRVEGLGWCWG